MDRKAILMFAGVALLYIFTGFWLSWNVSLTILIIGILSAIMALGVNMQWGYAGLFSTGIVGFVALGGLAVVFVSGLPVPDAFGAQGDGIFFVFLSRRVFVRRSGSRIVDFRACISNACVSNSDISVSSVDSFRVSHIVGHIVSCGVGRHLRSSNICSFFSCDNLVIGGEKRWHGNLGRRNCVGAEHLVLVVLGHVRRQTPNTDKTALATPRSINPTIAARIATKPTTTQV